MKLGLLRRDHTLLAAVGAFTAAGLIAIGLVLPAAFGVAVAIGGAFGALIVVYEVRLTKRIAQAEFIRDLQSGFTSDQNIVDLWSKLLLGEKIEAEDRPLVSSYLTFFETLHLLLSQGALELRLTDELFRNRFFTAVGNEDILDIALISQAGAFANVHELIEEWHAYLLENRLPIHPGYYSYVEALAKAKGHLVSPLSGDILSDLVELQDRVLAPHDGNDWSRPSPDVLREWIATHSGLAVHDAEGRLIAAAILCEGEHASEGVRSYLRSKQTDPGRSGALNMVVVDPDCRRSGLARTLIEMLEDIATVEGMAGILCAISPGDLPSRSLLRLLGYSRLTSVETSHGKRDVFGRTLPTREGRWTR